MYICIGGDLEGWVVRLGKNRFNAREIHRGKTSDYIKQKYLINAQVFCFWRHTEMSICDATRRIELIIAMKARSFDRAFKCEINLPFGIFVDCIMLKISYYCHINGFTMACSAFSL